MPGVEYGGVQAQSETRGAFRTLDQGLRESGAQNRSFTILLDSLLRSLPFEPVRLRLQWSYYGLPPVV